LAEDSEGSLSHVFVHVQATSFLAGLIKSMLVHLSTVSKMPLHILLMDVQIQLWPVDQQSHFFQPFNILAPGSYVQPVSLGIDGNPRPV
jgi:hypothetical protein